MSLNATTHSLRISLHAVCISSFQTLIPMLSDKKCNSYMLLNTVIYNYSIVKLNLLLKSKISRFIFMDYISKAHLNSLCGNQCKLVLETAFLAVTNYGSKEDFVEI